MTVSYGLEMSFVPSHLENVSRLACGYPPHHLRPCSLGDAAVRVHGPSCARRTPSSSLSHMNCSLARALYTLSTREGLAAREAAGVVQRMARRERISIEAAVKLLRTTDDQVFGRGAGYGN